MNNSEKMYEILNTLSGAFNDDTELNVKELLSSGEPGVALEILCTQLVEFDISVSPEVKKQLTSIQKSMNMDIFDLKFIKKK